MRVRIAICILLLVSVAAAQGAKAGVAKGAKTKTAVERTEAPAVPATTAASPEVTQDQVEAFLKRVYGFNQDIAFKVIQVQKSDAPGVTDAFVVASSAEGQQGLHFFILPDGKNVIMGEMAPFGADPFAANRQRLAMESFGPTKGPANAAVTIVEFADLQCPACKAAQRDVERLQTEFPHVKFVFQNFPFDMHPWANLAARYLDCIQRESNDKSVQFLQTVYIHQEEITPENAKEKLEKYAGMVGADGARTGVCAESQETKDRLARSIALGKSMRINSTPSIFVNGHPAIMRDYDHLKALVDFEVAQARAEGK